MSTYKLLLFSSLILLSSALSAQEYYRWVDADGVAHYSQQLPPEVTNAEQEELARTPLTVGIQDGTTITVEEIAETSNPEGNTLNSFGKDPDICIQVQQSLQTMNEFENIVMTDPDTGNGVYLSESEREAEKIRLEGMRNYYCE